MSRMEDLPYPLPDSLEGKVDYLAELIGIRRKEQLKRMPLPKAAELLTGLVLYHHLDRLGRREVSRLMGRAPRQVLNDLQTVMALPLVQKDWGMWSYSTTELLAKKEWLGTLNTWSGLLGFGLSLKSVGDIRQLLARAGGAPTAVLTLMIGGWVVMNQHEERVVDEEIMRRAQR